MKKQLTSIWESLLIMLAILCQPVNLFSQVNSIKETTNAKAYAAWCEDNSTLYFLSSSEPLTIGSKFRESTITKLWSETDVTDTGRNLPAWNVVKDDVLTVDFDESFNCIRPKSTYAWFVFFSKVNEFVGLHNLNTSDTEDMQAMFGYCSSVKHIDVTTLDTHNVHTMKTMFYGCSNLEYIDVDNFDTQNVENMESMFYECASLEELDVTNFNTGMVTDMGWMFYGCSSLKRLDLSHFDTKSVSSIRTMFGECHNLNSVNLENWNTEKVTNMRSLFFNCKALRSVNLSHFTTENNTSLTLMFSGCTNLEEVDLSSFNTKNVEECDSVFHYCSNLARVKLGHFDLEKARGIRHMFCECRSLTELDLRGLNTTNIKYMNSLFNACTQLRTIYVCDKWNTKNVDSSTGMFYNCYDLIGGNGTTYDRNHIDAAFARIDADGVPGYFTELKSDKIEASTCIVTKEYSWRKLDGSYLDTKPTQAGFYLYQGKKVLIK